MSFTQQIGNPNATYPPSLTLATSANGVGLVSIGSDVKYVTFNPIPSYSWIPLSTNPYENYFFEWYTGTYYEGDYYEGYTPDFATFNALNVRTLGLYYDEPRLSGVVNLDQYPNLDTLDLAYYDGNDISFLHNLLQNLYYLYLSDLPNTPTEQFNTLLVSLSNNTQLNEFGLGNISIKNATVNNVPQLKFLSLSNNQLTAVTLEDLPKLEQLWLNNNQFTTIMLQDLPQLRVVLLENNQLTDVVLQNLPQLNDIRLNNNPVKNLTIIGLSSLLNCDFRPGNGTITTCVLQDLASLTFVGITDNQLSSISMQNLPQLTYISVNDNQLSSLTLENLPRLENFTFTNNPIIEITLTNIPNVPTINIQAISSLQSIQLINSHAYIVVASNPQLTYVDVTGISASTVAFDNNNLPLSAVNHIAVQCDISGVINGYLSVQGGTNSPLSGVGITAKNNLIAKGWGVLSNP